MKRTISANIELQANKLDEENVNDSSKDDRCKFLPSEVISCYYEYPVSMLKYILTR